MLVDYAITVAAVRRFVEQRNVIAFGLQIETEVNARCAVVVVRVKHQILAGNKQRI